MDAADRAALIATTFLSLGFALSGCGSLATPRPLGADGAASARAFRSETDPCLTLTCFYVTNYHYPNYYVSAFPVGTNGDVPPSQVIGGGDTGLAGFGIAVDANRDIYVSNRYDRSVTTYAPGAGGNAVPIRTIYGRQTRLRRPADLALDADSNVIVVDFGKASEGAGSITVYPAGSNGDVTPVRRVIGPSTGLELPAYVAIGSDGNIYVANTGRESYDSVTVYAPTADGDAAPIRTIAGSDSKMSLINGIALDAEDNLYVASLGGKYSVVNEYVAGADGDVPPIRTIGGADTLLDGAIGVAVDTSGTIYVSNLGEGTRRRHFHSFVTVYAADASGDAPPIEVIAGKAAMLSTSLGIAVR